MIDVVIIGAGGMALDCIEIVEAMAADGSAIRIAGFLSDVAEDGPVLARLGYEVIGPFARLSEMRGVAVVVALGDGRHRRTTAAAVESSGAMPCTLRHPTATVGRTSCVGMGSILGPGSHITTAVSVGEFCILNVGSSASHGSRLGAYVTLSPGAVVCGDVQLGEGVFCGANSTVLEKRHVGDWSTIGAGAVVRQDLPAGCTAVGVPARIL